MTFNFTPGSKFTTHNQLILNVLSVVDTGVLNLNGTAIEILVANAVGRTGDSDTDPDRDLPKNLFYFRNDGVRLRQQGEDSDLNIDGVYLDPTVQTPYTAAAYSSNFGVVGSRVETANGLVLEITSVTSEGDFAARAVGRSSAANRVNRGASLPRNEFRYFADGTRHGGSNAEATRVVHQHFGDVEFDYDMSAVRESQTSATRVVGRGPVNPDDDLPY